MSYSELRLLKEPKEPNASVQELFLPKCPPIPTRFKPKADATLSNILRCRLLNLIDNEMIMRPSGKITTNYPAPMVFYANILLKHAFLKKSNRTFEFRESGHPVPGFPDIKVLDGQLTTVSRKPHPPDHGLIYYTVVVRACFKDESGNRIQFQGSVGKDVSMESILVNFTTTIYEVLDNTYNRDAVISLLKQATQAVFDEHGEKWPNANRPVKIPVYGEVTVVCASSS
ncbi:hypothetical protein GLAREA_12397 [Glarea lozoyensis ATCC 20868]|uniref:Uncharacterized protein n=1 Tax=Glarea lozoyensis (strain ATCC 20868 / MF5171) TaxID=1116229 RepID=S3DHX5_GLAL2|nr:uncharacterized protein GLAREA_12397 [Glarea lozoyensis ATCC 20868]EPE31641.1 hypothetical protein GLAREA_12397 [Glarea lozoyensis ATCC 20868]